MKEFLQLFWGNTLGYYCVGEKVPKGMVHRFYQSIDEVEKDLRRNSQKGNHLYFTPSVYSSPNRLQEKVKAIKAFWLDVDCGETKPYKSKQEGLDALAEFLNKTKLPLPYIVDSGTGIHIYWVLKDPIEPSLWMQMASGLKALTVLHKFEVDQSRTADSASLLRPIGTYNYKTTPPRQVLCIKQAKECDLSELEILTKTQATCKSEIGSLDIEFPEAEAELVLEKCPAMKDIADRKGAVEEPLWRAFLSVLFRCTNGAKLCHELSKGDPRYSFKETQEKAEKTKGPYSCGQFQSLCPNACSGCPFRGKITSPILLGCTPRGISPEQVTKDVTVLEDSSESTQTRICKVEGYTVTQKGILREDERSYYITRIPIWVKSVREKARRLEESGDSSVQLEWVTLGGRYQTAVLPQVDLYEKRTFTKWLAENNIRAVVQGKIEHLQDYITKCILEIMKLNTVERYYETLGWADDGFVLGKRIITPSGVNPTALQTSSSVSAIVAKGSKSRWVTATGVFSDISLWPSAFALLCGFASPLLSICRYQGAIVSLFGNSGYGKTVAGSMALSIYGDPAILTQAASATTNAINKQLSAHKNVPYFLDEVSNMPPYKLADFIYDAANGRQKDVLDKNRDLHQGLGWCLVPFISSNRSVLEMSTMYIQEAHRRRVIEIPFDNKIDAKAAAVLAEAYQDNYGTVADDYLLYVVNHKEEIRNRVNDVLKYSDFMRIPSVNRFGTWTIACALVAGQIAKSLGLIEFDPQTVISQVLDTFTKDVVRIVDDKDIAKSALVAFLHENAFAINVWSTDTANAISLTAARQIYARYDPKGSVYYIQKLKYESIIREAGLSMRGLSSWHKQSGIEETNIKLAETFPITRCYMIPSSAIDVNIEQLVSGKTE